MLGVREQPFGVVTLGEGHVLHDGDADKVQILVGHERLQIDHLAIAAPRERAIRVEHVGDAAAHAGGEVASRAADHHTRPPVMYSQP